MMHSTPEDKQKMRDAIRAAIASLQEGMVCSASNSYPATMKDEYEAIEFLHRKLKKWL